MIELIDTSNIEIFCLSISIFTILKQEELRVYFCGSEVCHYDFLITTILFPLLESVTFNANSVNTMKSQSYILI